MQESFSPPPLPPTRRLPGSNNKWSVRPEEVATTNGREIPNIGISKLGIPEVGIPQSVIPKLGIPKLVVTTNGPLDLG